MHTHYGGRSGPVEPKGRDEIRLDCIAGLLWIWQGGPGAQLESASWMATGRQPCKPRLSGWQSHTSIRTQSLSSAENPRNRDPLSARGTLRNLPLGSPGRCTDRPDGYDGR